MRGLQCLVVNAYDNVGKSASQFKILIKLIKTLLGEESLIIEKNIYEVGDYIFDWENEVLDETTKTIAKRFDKLDMIFISGDSKVLPWDPAMHDVVLLLHMCNFVKKPVVCTGSGAFHSMYTLSTKGIKFNIINGPDGNAIDRLKIQPTYSIGSDQNPSGWLDSETGDIYRYDKQCTSWIPMCCIGSYRIPAHGTPSDLTLKPPTKKYGRDIRRLVEQTDVQALNENEDKVQVRNIAQQHYLMHKIPLPKFVLVLPNEWHLNSDGGLPSHDNIFILADGSHGPVLLTFDNTLILAADISQGPSYHIIRQLFKNFIRNTVLRLIAENPNIAPAGRFMDKLFGSDGRGDALEPVTKYNRSLAPSLASSMVPSTLSKGPKRITSMYSPRGHSKNKDVVAQPGAGDHIDYTALLSPRGHTTLGKVVPVALKKEGVVRTKRLDIFLASQGHAEMQPLNKKAAKLAEKMRGKQNVYSNEPDSARVMFGDEVLREPSPRKKKIVNDTRQIYPPGIRFDRPMTAVNERWQNGKDNFRDDPNQGVITDHLLGKWGLDERVEHDNQRPATSLGRLVVDVESNHIPRRHPTRKVRIPDLVDRKGNPILPMTSPTKPKASKNYKTIPVEPGLDYNTTVGGTRHVEPIIVRDKITKRPYNNFMKYEKMISKEALEMTMNLPFLGTYSQPYRSENEKAIYEYTESKKKFLAGSFNAQSGKASQIPLRPVAQVGPQGVYPDNPNVNGAKASDFVMFAKNAEISNGKTWK